jgi:hypothetical protein
VRVSASLTSHSPTTARAATILANRQTGPLSQDIQRESSFFPFLLQEMGNLRADRIT